MMERRSMLRGNSEANAHGGAGGAVRGERRENVC